eukprot:s2273_g4.t1
MLCLSGVGWDASEGVLVEGDRGEEDKDAESFVRNVHKLWSQAKTSARFGRTMGTQTSPDLQKPKVPQKRKMLFSGVVQIFQNVEDLEGVLCP